MFNHASHPNVNWENEFMFENRKDHYINATALEDIAAGEELFIYYGRGSASSSHTRGCIEMAFLRSRFPKFRDWDGISHKKPRQTKFAF